MKIIECVQGSDEWRELHRGRPTAGSFNKIITPKTGVLSSQADDLICELIAQRAYVGPMELLYTGHFGSGPGLMTKPMQDGLDTEAEARAFFSFETGLTVRQVGMCLTDDERFGASPDGLVYEGEELIGGLELKCPLLKTQVKYLLDGCLPDEYKPQVHGGMVVTGLTSWWFLSYCPPLDHLLIKVEADAYTLKLDDALGTFWGKYQACLVKMGMVRMEEVLQEAVVALERT